MLLSEGLGLPVLGEGEGLLAFTQLEQQSPLSGEPVTGFPLKIGADPGSQAAWFDLPLPLRLRHAARQLVDGISAPLGS